jgi:hypothetical protein
MSNSQLREVAREFFLITIYRTENCAFLSKVRQNPDAHNPVVDNTMNLLTDGP